MRAWLNHTVKNYTTISFIGTLLLVSAHAVAETPKYNLLSFEVQTQKSVENNQITAIMSKTMHAKTAKELANKLNPIVNQAVVIAKKYPTIKLQTSNQSAYPDYVKGKMTGVSGSTSLTLKTQDSEALNSLITELQNQFLLEHLSFDISDELREQTNTQLQDETVHKFRQEAMRLVKAWEAKEYRLVNAQMNAQANYHRKTMAMPMLAEQASDASTASPSLEVGTSEIGYTINGTIELVF